MEKVSVSAEQMGGFVLELFKVKPWLTTGEVMKESDASSEAEAIDFLLALDAATGWGNCSMPARRVANSLLLDFMANLLHPGTRLSRCSWEVPRHDEPWRQASYGIAQEIRRSHPRFQSPH